MYGAFSDLFGLLKLEQDVLSRELKGIFFITHYFSEKFHRKCKTIL